MEPKYHPLVTRYYRSNGEEYQGTIRSLAKECTNFTERAWKCEDVRIVQDPKTGRDVESYKLGEMVREIHYVSNMRGDIAITYVWENGKQMFPKLPKED